MIEDIIYIASFVATIITSLFIGKIYYVEMRKYLSKKWTLITSLLWFLPIYSLINMVSKMPRAIYLELYGDVFTIMFLAITSAIVYLIWSAILLFHHGKFAWLLFGPVLANPMAIFLIFWYYPVLLVFRVFNLTWDSISAQFKIWEQERKREEKLNKMMKDFDSEN